MERNYFRVFGASTVKSVHGIAKCDLYDMNWIYPGRSLKEKDSVNAEDDSENNKVNIRL